MDGRRVRGQGVADMTGGNVVMLEALRALKSAGVLEGRAIAVLLTGDEKSVGQPIAHARAELIELAKKSDIALSFEGMGLGPEGDDLDGLGAIGGGAHSPFEFLLPGSIEKNAIRAAVLIYRLAR